MNAADRPVSASHSQHFSDAMVVKAKEYYYYKKLIIKHENEL